MLAEGFQAELLKYTHKSHKIDPDIFTPMVAGAVDLLLKGDKATEHPSPYMWKKPSMER